MADNKYYVLKTHRVTFEVRLSGTSNQAIRVALAEMEDKALIEFKRPVLKRKHPIKIFEAKRV